MHKMGVCTIFEMEHVCCTFLGEFQYVSFRGMGSLKLTVTEYYTYLVRYVTY